MHELVQDRDFNTIILLLTRKPINKKTQRLANGREACPALLMCSVDISNARVSDILAVKTSALGFAELQELQHRVKEGFDDERGANRDFRGGASFSDLFG